MKLIQQTENLNVFETDPFHLFADEPKRVKRHLYVGFVRDAEDDPKRWPAVTALVTFSKPPDRMDDFKHLDWLETSKYTGSETELDGQEIRDEFMEALTNYLDTLNAVPEAREADDGSVYYLDTLDAEKERDAYGADVLAASE